MTENNIDIMFFKPGPTMTDIISNNENNTKITEMLRKIGDSDESNLKPHSWKLYIRKAVYDRSSLVKKWII